MSPTRIDPRREGPFVGGISVRVIKWWHEPLKLLGYLVLGAAVSTLGSFIADRVWRERAPAPTLGARVETTLRGLRQNSQEATELLAHLQLEVANRARIIQEIEAQRKLLE